MQPTQWIGQQIAALASLSGETVMSWAGIEMAFAGGVFDEPPVFEDVDVPCLQFLRLEALLDTDSRCELSTYRNDLNWGLCCDIDDEPLRSSGWTGIYRYVRDFDLPTGLIRRVEVWLADTGDIAEVVIDIGGEELLFVAGEVYEGDLVRPFCLGWLDESVLVFASPPDAETLNWRSRGSRELVPNPDPTI